jgi:hypothetical protein
LKWEFKAEILLIGSNPYVVVPDAILNALFEKAGRNKGPIPIWGKLNRKIYRQTLVRYRGAWRLYINSVILLNSPKRIGDVVEISIDLDPADRTVKTPSALILALNRNRTARKAFSELTPSRKKEISRYIGSLKTKEAVERNVKRAVDFLSGKGRFVGRGNP